MQHEHYKTLMVLSLYGELDLEQQRELEAHVAQCRLCQAGSRQLKKLHSMLTDTGKEPSQQLLFRARSELHQQLLKRSSPPRFGQRAADWIGALMRPAFLGAAAVLIVGVAVGYLVALTRLSDQPAPSLEMDPFAANGVQISEVQFGETDPVTGDVRLGFLASRQFHLQGQVSDPRIQKLLAYALVNAKNAGVRLRAVSAIETDSSRPPREEIQNALIAALKTDPNVAVREKALLSLRQYPLNSSIQEALIQVLLYDENAKLRIEAISSLEIAVAEMPEVDPDLRDALQNRVESDQNRYIRLRARAVLQEVSQQ
jgi:hypothetical protein